MSTWQYILRGSLVYKWPLIAHTILNISISVAFPTLVALTQRSVFDSLTGHATAGFGVWELIGILVALGVVSTLQHAGSVVAYYFGAFNVRAFFQRNIFAYMMNLPGYRPLPHSSGEAVNRFRDDVQMVHRLPGGHLKPPRLQSAGNRRRSYHGKNKRFADIHRFHSTCRDNWGRLLRSGGHFTSQRETPRDHGRGDRARRRGL